MIYRQILAIFSLEIFNIHKDAYKQFKNITLIGDLSPSCVIFG